MANLRIKPIDTTEKKKKQQLRIVPIKDYSSQNTTTQNNTQASQLAPVKSKKVATTIAPKNVDFFQNLVNNDKDYNSIKNNILSKNKNTKNISEQVYDVARKNESKIAGKMSQEVNSTLAKDYYATDKSKFTNTSKRDNTILGQTFEINDPKKEFNEILRKATNTNQYKELAEKRDKAQNTVNLAKYVKSKDEVSNHKTNLYDRTIGNTLSGARDLASNLLDLGALNLGGTDYVDSKGNKIWLPSKSDLKQQKLQEDTKSGVGRFLNDVNHEVGKQATRLLISKIPAVGGILANSLYYSDSYMDSYKNATNSQIQVNGKADKGKAVLNGVINAGMDFAFDKLGDVVAKQVGINSGASKSGEDLLDKLTNFFVKKGMKPKMAKVTASTLSEAGQEGVENFVEALTDLLTIGQDQNGNKSVKEIFTDPQTYKDAAYSALVGGATGGIFAGVTPDNTQARRTMYTEYKNNLQETINNELSKPEGERNNKRIENYQGIISKIDEYVNAPYGKENTAKDINNSILENENQIENNKEYKSIIDEKVNNYIENNKNNFVANTEIDTNIVSKGDIAPLNYKTAKQTTIYKKARNLFKNIGRKVFKNNLEDIYVNNTDIRESVDKTIKNPQQSKYMIENLSVFSKLDSIIENAQEISFSGEDTKGRKQYSNYKYYVSNVKIDGKDYVVEFDTRMQNFEGKAERHFRLERIYPIEKEVSATGTNNIADQFGTETSFYNNDTINSKESKVSSVNSMQQNENYKIKQLEIIKKSNPAPNETNTWIRNENDIKSFNEAFFENEEYSGMDPDFTQEMAQEALDTGKVMVYSSYPIKNGTFVSPSKLEASQYAGGNENNLYSKEVNINDVAWIDGAEGQYAKVEEQKTKDNNLSLEQRVSGDELLDAQDLIEELKGVGAKVDNNGYVTVYHQTSDENAKNILETGKMTSKENGVFFSTSKDAQQSEGRGQSKLEFKIPAEKLVLDDLFSDNADVKIPLNQGRELDVSDYIVKDDKIDNNNEVKNTIEPLRQEISQLQKDIQDIKKSVVKENNTIAEEKTNDEQVLTIRPDRKQYSINKRVQKAIENSSYKGIKKATAEADKYIKFSTQERRAFKEAISKYAGMTKEDFTNVDNYREIEAIVENFANREYNYVDTELKSVKNQVRKTNIKVSDDLKNRITDYNDFRKSNFGKLRLGSEGQSIDEVWSELSATHPEYFSENITNEEDMLYTLSDFMNEDTNLTEQFRLSDKDIEKVRDKVFNTLSHNQLNESDINELQTELDKVVERKKRTVVQENLLHEMGITREDIQQGDDVSAFAYQRTDPIRLHEKVFGYETGQKINDATVNQVKHNEAERTRFLNKERDEIKALGIKARSEESSAVQKYAEKQYMNNEGEYIKYGDKELAKEFPNVITQNKIKKAANVLRNKYDTYIDSINEVLVDMGYDPIPKRDNYMKHFYEITDKLSQWGVPFNRNDMSAEDLPTDINGITDQFKPGKNWFASAMERKGVRTVYDAITGIDSYLEGASNLIYHTEDIQRYRTLSKFIREEFGQQHGLDNIESMSEEDFKQKLDDIQNHKLSKYVAWLDEQANSMAGKKGAIDRSVERMFGRKVYTALNTLKSQVGSNMTGFNVRSAMTNFASAIQGASKTSKLGFLQGTWSTLQNIVHKDNLIDKSDFLTTRFGSDTLSQKMWQKVSNAGQIFMTGTDYFTANQIWRSKYFENLNKGMTESSAIKNADDFASRIMGDRSKGQTAEIFNSKTLGFLTQFQLEVNNQWSSLIHDNKMDIQSGNKSGATVVFQLGQLFGASYLFNNLMKAVTGSKVMIDPIDMLKKIFGDDDDKSIEERAEEALGDLLNDVPMASIFTGGRIPIQEAFTGVETFAKKATGQTDKYGGKYTWGNVGEDFLESAFYWLLPTGYGQAKKAVKGISMYYNVRSDKKYYGKGNIDLNHRKTVKNDDGSISTELSFSFNEDGKEVLIPTVVNGKIVSDEDAIEHYHKTGEHLGKFNTVKEAEDYAEWLHNRQDDFYNNKVPVAGSYTKSGNLRFEADTSAWGKTKAFLFGQYASKSAQDYVNRGYSTVDKDKVNEMKKLDMSSGEYNKLKKEITKATKTQDEKKNYKYFDEDGKIYYYNKGKDIVYDSNYKKTSIDIDELDKAKRKELLEKFLKKQKNLTDKQKEYLLKNTFKGGKK